MTSSFAGSPRILGWLGWQSRARSAIAAEPLHRHPRRHLAGLLRLRRHGARPGGASVSPSRRGRGVGAALLLAVSTNARRRLRLCRGRRGRAPAFFARVAGAVPIAGSTRGCIAVCCAIPGLRCASPRVERMFPPHSVHRLSSFLVRRHVSRSPPPTPKPAPSRTGASSPRFRHRTLVCGQPGGGHRRHRQPAAHATAGRQYDYRSPAAGRIHASTDDVGRFTAFEPGGFSPGPSPRWRTCPAVVTARQRPPSGGPAGLRIMYNSCRSPAYREPSLPPPAAESPARWRPARRRCHRPPASSRRHGLGRSTTKPPG
jgi:hypothetical protein